MSEYGMYYKERVSKTAIMDALFEQSGYDKRLRPPTMQNNTDHPLEIRVSILVRSIEDINDKDMQYLAQLTYRQEWVDTRLQYADAHSDIEYLQLGESVSKLWLPDVFFVNEKHGRLHELMLTNQFTRLNPEGRIIQSFRVTLLLSCPMNLAAYPLDVQQCPIEMESYGWTIANIVLKWREDEPVDMSRNFSLPRFRIGHHEKSTSCTGSMSTGTYSCLKLNFVFERELGFYLIQIYMPGSMLSLVSWVNFWLEPTAVEARVFLGVTTILAIVTQTYGINQSAPPSSYIKAMDVFSAFCNVMVFGSLLEFALINYIIHLKVLKRKKFGQIAKASDKMEIEAEVIEALVKAKKIDRYARFLFPLSFVIFNIVYWAYYLNYYKF